MLKRLVLAVVLVLLLAGPSKAWADIEQNVYGDLGGGSVKVRGTTPGSPGVSGGGGGGGAGGKTSTGCFSTTFSINVPCTSSVGAWSSHWQAYCEQVEVSADHPVWKGHEGQGGAAYLCTYPDPDGGDPQAGKGGQGTFGPVWLASPPTLPPPDPAEMAARLLATLDFDPVVMGSGSGGWLEDDPDALGAVGLPNWLWVEGRSPTTTGPQVASASERGYNVTLTAKVVDIEWDMGDGSAPIKCRGFGKPFDPKTMTVATPVVCGRQNGYQKEGEYTVTATAHWRVEWSGIGESGVINFDTTARRHVRIGEIQVVTDR